MKKQKPLSVKQILSLHNENIAKIGALLDGNADKSNGEFRTVHMQIAKMCENQIHDLALLDSRLENLERVTETLVANRKEINFPALIIAISMFAASIKFIFFFGAH